MCLVLDLDFRRSERTSFWFSLEWGLFWFSKAVVPLTKSQYLSLGNKNFLFWMLILNFLNNIFLASQLVAMGILCRIIEYCVKKRLQWNSCFARKVCKEREYYENMLRYLRKNLAVCALQTVCYFIWLLLKFEILHQIHYDKSLYALVFIHMIRKLW